MAETAEGGRILQDVPHWLIWVIVGAILAAGEVFTLTFVLAPIAIAALISALLSTFDIGIAGEVAIFTIAAIGMLVAVQPIARAHRRTPLKARTGVAALIGQRAVVLERVDRNGGRVKLAGEVWSARTLEHDRVFEAGAEVSVAEIQGATAIVME